jgi:hypothetical protein
VTRPTDADIDAFRRWAEALTPAGHVQARVGLWLLAEVDRLAGQKCVHDAPKEWSGTTAPVFEDADRAEE